MQWIPAYQVTEENLRTIAATFLQAFPDATILCGDPESKHPMLGLLGTKDSKLDWDEMDNRFHASVTQHAVKDPVLQAEDFASSLYVANLSEQQLADVRINTLENAILEITAGRHRATHDRRKSKAASTSPTNSYLRGEIWTAFLQKMRQPSAEANGAR